MNRSKNISVVLRTASEEAAAAKLYEKKYARKLLEYFQCWQNEKLSYIDVEKSVQRGDKKACVADAYPTIYGFLNSIGITKGIFDIWRRDHVEFDRACELAKQAQLDKLMKNALNGAYNATIAKLELTATHGLSETEEEGPLEIKLTVI